MKELIHALRELGHARRHLAVKAAQDRLIRQIVQRDAGRN